MKIKSKKIVENEASYCLTTKTFHNFVIPFKNGNGIVVSQCWAGAQALNGFDTYLAPFIKKDTMTYAEVKQCLQYFLFSINVPSRWGGQSPFSNVTLDLFVPEDLKDKHPIIGGKKQPFTYGDLQEEINIFNKAFFEVFEAGDYKGNIFQYPIPTLNCTSDFFEKLDPQVEEAIYRLTGKFGIFYFSNFISTEMSPTDIRSMCVHPDTSIKVELEENYIDNDTKIIHKKGDIISLPIKNDVKYKIKTSNGFEQFKYKEIHRYAGSMLSIYLENNIHAYDCIPVHECLIKENGKLIERKASDLKKGDIFINENNEEHKIHFIKSYNFDGYVYSFGMPSRNYYANGFLTKNCCRLRLNLAELTRKNGSLFGSGDNTGSIGVVTLNLPKIGYLSHTEEELFNRIEALMCLAKTSLERKRVKVTEWFDKGLYPYTKRYLKAKFDNHFSTIGLVGMNELCRNYFRNTKKKDWNLSTKEGLALTLKILNFMRQKCSDFQVETGNLYNLESTPAESTAYRLAMHDKKKYPDILTAGTIQSPYYTNSTNLPVDFSDNPWDAIEIQNKIQKLYTGGTTFHLYLSESIDDYWKIKDFLKKVMYNTELPYLTITPSFSHCTIHGFIKGDTGGICPKCKEEAVANYEKTLNELEEKKLKILQEIEQDNCCNNL